MKKILSRTAAAAVSAGLLLTGTAAANAAETPAPAKQDLAVSYSSSALKAPGYAGLTAIYAENVGSERYYGEFPLVTFRVDVKTAGGPEGVDRLITPGYFNGAYTRDLGFDPATSTRSFEVTLSNPVEKGEKQLIANLNFGDGLTKEGRLTNYVTVTQTGRLAGDTSTANDQNVDSRQHTVTDFGNPNKGIF
ncbi:hypothetical protein [Kocuria palustris]|uniref:hypothetical protein n=1 Tax=Kocuria palustris TaxID=71999 RepID=UPI0011A2A473|nr:hypothetical protein [Kocuria palustris]